MSRDHRPRKRFGQHFLTDPQIVRDIVEAIGASTDDTLVEIGPGRGAITIPLLESGATIHAIELDRDLARDLGRRLAHAQNFVLHQADALDFDLRRLGDDLRVAGNLPYNISTPLLFRMLDYLDAIRDMHFMLQKEVVDRMAAEPGSRRYGRLTVMLGCRTRVEQLMDVPPEAFSPAPKVWSSVVRLLPRREDAPQIDDEALLEKLVMGAFSQRRKTLRNALRDVVSCETLEATGIDPGSRAETVPAEAWVRLANRLAGSG